MTSLSFTAATAAQDAVCAIGIDIGGTKIAGGIVLFPTGEVKHRQIIATEAARGPEAVLADVCALAGRLMQRVRSEGFPASFAGVGLAVPELVDLQGEVTSGQTIDWRGVSLRERLAPLGPVHVDADVRAAALAESLFGAGRSYRLFVYVTVGTGISSTIVWDGKPHAGARGNALVLGSGALSGVCTNCGTMLRSVLEQVASGPALVSRYNQMSPAGAASAEEVVAAAEAHDTVARRVVEQAGEALASSVAFLVNVIDPEAVIVGGGLGLAGGRYWEAFVRSARSHIWAETTRALPIVPAASGADAGLIGAAATAWRHS